MDSSPDSPKKTRRLSLARRILIGALLWSALIVVGGVVATSEVYRAQTINLLDSDLDSTLETLARAIEPLEDGSGRIREIPQRLPTDPRFETPLSGQYWVIIAVEDDRSFSSDIRPRSVWDGEPPLPAALAEAALNEPGAVIRGNHPDGPAGEPIRIAVQSITLPNRDNPILLVAASDRTQSNDGADQLRTILIIAMTTLAGGTLLAMALGLRFALRPLDRIQSDISDIREGRQAQLSNDYPQEVQPLSAELNKLLEHNRSVVSRARTHVGNLAHALKTPLAVLRNEAKGDSQLDAVVRRQTESMHANVEHYLRRAQAAARAEALGVRTQVLEAADGIARVMNKLFAREGKQVTVEIPVSLYVRTEQQDLEEILGNLLDNACKWTRNEVSVSAEGDDDGMIVIHIDDDGPGLSPEQREQAVKRGVRLDETAPGTGLGLSIVADIAGMNGGSLTLDESPQGGLRASVRLRRA
ncbi:MAG: sensor histidine kinase [Hyphomonadaceae bacterium]|nr:sensor histidine kinase [Hyphomonadaceae bacterium]